MWSSRCKMPPSSPFERRSKAALHLAANIRLAKERARFSLDFDVENLGNLCWIALPSSNRLFRLPSFQDFSLLSRQAMCSFVFEALCGFCRRRIGRTVAALSAIDLSADVEAKARNSLDGSLTNSLPALLKGAVDGFWVLELLVQDPSLLGRQFAQGFPAFTQAHPLQEPVLLHLQHGMVQLSLSLSPQKPYISKKLTGAWIFNPVATTLIKGSHRIELMLACLKRSGHATWCFALRETAVSAVGCEFVSNLLRLTSHV